MTLLIRLRIVCLSLLLAAGLGCGGGSFSPSPQALPTAAPPPSASVLAVPVFSHVFVVVEENHGYSSVIGSSSMPYLNSLASKYGLATQYYANTHPSIGNYFMMTTGRLITNNDSYSTTVTVDNLARRFLTGGETFKSYAESMQPTTYGYKDAYPYVRRHNPFAYFSDVINSSTWKNYLVPFSQFPTDMKSNRLPQFSFIIPNQKNNAHDGTLNQADLWLKTNIAPLLINPAFSQNGLLIILFDEAATSDASHGGGRIATLIISPKGKKPYKSTTLYQHQSLLRLVLQGLGITIFPGASNTAPSMTEFFF